jgi:hypothetical protein
VPAAERGGAEKALASRAAPAQPCEPGPDGGLVQEHQTVREFPHPALPAGLVLAPVPHVSPLALCRDQSFFI